MPHRVATSPSAAAAQNSAPSRDSGHAAAPQSLIDELEDAITKKNLRQRAAVMRRVTDLFILNGAGFSEDHIAMFDDVMSKLVAAIDRIRSCGIRQFARGMLQCAAKDFAHTGSGR